jgi:hypothetical protein
MIIIFIIIILICYLYKTNKEQFNAIKNIDILEIGIPKYTDYINNFNNINRLILCKPTDYLNIKNKNKTIINTLNNLDTISYEDIIKLYKLKKVNQIYIYDELYCNNIIQSLIHYCIKHPKFFPNKLYLNTSDNKLLNILQLNGYYINILKSNNNFFTTLIKYNFLQKNKVSIIILNYNRKHNLVKSIPILDKIPIIDEIIIANGNNNNINDVYSDKIVNLDDSHNNDDMFTLRRFFLSKYVKNDIIIMLDDDVIPSTKLIYNMISHYNNDKKNIYGVVKRCCYSDGYYCNKNDCSQSWNRCELFDKYNVILTGLTLIPTKVMKKVSKNMLKEPMFKEVIENKGNGEDLLFNYVFRKIYNKKPIYVDGDFSHLDNKNGFSASESGMNFRSNLCKKFNFNQFSD